MQRSLCPAGILLKSWLSEADIFQDAFAEAIGTTRVSVWRWMVGEVAPSADFAAAIEGLTGIPARMWATTAGLRGVPKHEVTSSPPVD
jgi:hypothetical protein